MYPAAQASARQAITLENRRRRGGFLAGQPVKYTHESVLLQLSAAIAIHRQLQSCRVAQLLLMSNHQSEPDKCAAAKADHGRIVAECSSSASPCWPPSSSAVNSNSFFRQLFVDDEDTGAVVDGLLLPQPPPSAAFEVGVGDDKYSADSVFQLGTFPMVDSFMDTAAIASDSAAIAGQPHTLEFVTSPNYIADSPTSADHDLSCAEPLQRQAKPGPRNLLLHEPAHGDDAQEMTSFKKPKIRSPSDPHGGSLVDQSQFQPPLHKVSHSQQTARSKEKLGERINALQQLVSPYGKTDTASVLSEAIGYIKFLQEQVQVLSSPYMKPSNTLSAINRQDMGVEAASDLRSRGLCLVPVSCTMTVANNNSFNIGADYWASTQNFSSSLASGGAASTRFSAA